MKIDFLVFWMKDKKKSIFPSAKKFVKINLRFFLYIFTPMISVHAKNFVLPEWDQEKIEAKAEKLLHLAKDMADESTNIRLEFELVSKRKELIKGSITISLPGNILRAEAEEEKNVVSIMDELEREIRPQIEKHKNKNS